jgi:hypothetical protein
MKQREAKKRRITVPTVLPNELYISIFTFLPDNTLMNIELVCKQWREMTQHNDQYLWKICYQNTFPIHTNYQSSKHEDYYHSVLPQMNDMSLYRLTWKQMLLCRQREISEERISTDDGNMSEMILNYISKDYYEVAAKHIRSVTNNGQNIKVIRAKGSIDVDGSTVTTVIIFLYDMNYAAKISFTIDYVNTYYISVGTVKDKLKREDRLSYLPLLNKLFNSDDSISLESLFTIFFYREDGDDYC